ncbi:hypothetical protein SAMN04489859_10479 [Paracoccus alcaliphilus]|uniref:Major Facilitator Superfamily protein n=1 Tax=Paracoccus alcaliphilus TaxID=34002 RepID=A0A1H8MX45_9RHOB|nr:hypothetical protein [Paracoccus alcaliphilus]WCR19609.1 hypothetical protein JHW40_08165 [Paracoccus alcaliphilus]SEO21850.1 hypothetical protein SAMN04489859_10479 [Paracoccus alcaliphilus]
MSTETQPKTEGLGLPLAVIATAQLMVALDDTIANIVLPTIQNDLDISAANLPWVSNAYILALAISMAGGASCRPAWRSSPSARFWSDWRRTRSA